MPASILTVTAAAQSRALCAAGDVAADLGLDAANPRLSAECAAASAAAEAWTGRVFAREGLTETFRLAPGERPEFLVLARFPVAAVASVTEDGVSLAASAWELEPTTGLLFRLADDDRTAWAARKVVVAYTAGYSPIPPDVARAARIIAASSWHARGADPRVRSEAAEGVGTVSYLDPRAGAEALPAEALGLLAPYRVPRL